MFELLQSVSIAKFSETPLPFAVFEDNRQMRWLLGQTTAQLSEDDLAKAQQRLSLFDDAALEKKFCARFIFSESIYFLPLRPVPNNFINSGGPINIMFLSREDPEDLFKIKVILIII